MLRKVVSLGGTQVVSLPAPWLKAHKVRKGDSLEVQEQGSLIIISPGDPLRGSQADIDVRGCGSAIKRILGALYKAGFDEVRLRCDDAIERSQIEKTLKVSLRTYAISSQDEGSITIKNLAEAMPGEFEQMLRRMFLLILQNLEAVREHEEGIEERDLEINNCADFCRRALCRAGHLISPRPSPLYSLIEQLEKVGDGVRDLAGSDEKGLEAVERSIRGFYELNYRFDLQRFARWLEDLKAAREGKNSPKLQSVLDLLHGMSGPLLCVRLAVE